MHSSITDIYRESCNHYRHLESQRSQHLGFYFTFLPASVALAATVVKSTRFESDFFLWIEIAFLLNLVIGLFITAAINKIESALEMHTKVIQKIGGQILTECKTTLEQDTNPFNPQNPIYKSKILSVRRSVSYILISISLILDILYIVVMTKINSIDPCIVYIVFGVPIVWILPFQLMKFYEITHPPKKT